MREELARLLDGLTGTVRFGDDDPRWVHSSLRVPIGKAVKSSL